jgi:hypothetical protein
MSFNKELMEKMKNPLLWINDFKEKVSTKNLLIDECNEIFKTMLDTNQQSLVEQRFKNVQFRSTKEPQTTQLYGESIFAPIELDKKDNKLTKNVNLLMKSIYI